MAHLLTVFEHIKVATACMAYLCLKIFNGNLSQDEIARNVLDGLYCWQDYAEEHWLNHICEAVKGIDSEKNSRYDIGELVETLDNILSGRFANIYLHAENSATTQGVPSASKDFEVFKDINPILHQKLVLVMQYFQAQKAVRKAEMYQYTKEVLEKLASLEVVNFEHLGLSLPKRIERLKYFYGEYLFHCSRKGCQYNSLKGFVSLKDRTEHEAKHTRPFKCSNISCAFATMGFTSSRLLQQHIERFHAGNVPIAELSYEEEPSVFYGLGFDGLMSPNDLMSSNNSTSSNNSMSFKYIPRPETP
ncbi:hypothetical protein RUND412_010192 [Rhizina undulata]